LRHLVEAVAHARVIGTSLIVVGLVMALVERLARHERAMESLTLRDALIIGLGQTLALVPGVSRSGITLAVGMAIGLRRDAAAASRFCCRFGGGCLRLSSSFPSCCTITTWESRPAHWPGRCWRSGYLCIRWLLRFLRTRTTYSFVIYESRLGSHFLPLFSRGSWREAPSVPLRRPPCVASHPPAPARFARPSRHDLLRLSPQGPNSYLDRSGRDRYSSCSC